MTSLKINEIFFSLQGESSRVGFPTIFIRLTGCPMRCSYCDTAYAFHGGKNMSLDEINLIFPKKFKKFEFLINKNNANRLNCIYLPIDAVLKALK